MAEAGANMAPIDAGVSSRTSPVFNCRYRRTREALVTLSRHRAINPWHGHKMRYLNPLPGDMIYTGTPAGVAALQPAVRVIATLEGVGRLEIEFVQSNAR